MSGSVSFDDEGCFGFPHKRWFLERQSRYCFMDYHI